MQMDLATTYSELVPSAFTGRAADAGRPADGMRDAAGRQDSWDDEILALRRDQELAAATLAAIGDGIVRTGADGRIDFLNRAAEELTGWRAERALGRRVEEVFRLIDEVTRRPLADPVARSLDEGRVVRSGEHALLLGAAGKEYSVHHSAAPIFDLAGRLLGAVLVFNDVTEMRGMEREMIYLASHDPLTGLLNRREFETRLRRAILTAGHDDREHALLYLDLDEFKVVNDTCGHLAGDEMLKQVTALLRAGVRRGDTLARLGGDEFGVLLENCPAEQARQTAEELRRKLRDHRFALRGHVFEVGVSIGLVAIGRDSGDLAQVLSGADAACYVAKDRGRNRVQVYEADDTGVAQHHGEMRWIQRIHRSFEERRFRLYYQSIEPLGRGAGGAAGAAAGSGPAPICEILVRMLGDDGQPIEPAAFVAAAERYHLIDSLDRWVVQTAFAAVAEAQRAGAGAALFAINLSAKSLSDERFLSFVLAELAAKELDPRRICFEITETAALNRLGSAVRFLSTLKEMGCRFALDDFGGGLSSFSHLRNLPVDFLKIDGALVQQMTVDPVKRAMVESINQIGHVMGLRTIAEWVESQEILDHLEAIGVDYGQGFWFSGVAPLIHDH